jgi:hypothetical protein
VIRFDIFLFLFPRSNGIGSEWNRVISGRNRSQGIPKPAPNQSKLTRPGFKYRICPQKPLAFNPWKEMYHEKKLALPGRARPALLKAASATKHAGPLAPTGDNCVDVEVYTVKGRSIQIQGCTAKKPFTVSCAECFPIVEGIFGPLRVPVLRSTVVLDKEYGEDWPTTRKVKLGSIQNQSQPSKWSTVSGDTVRRAAWPNVELPGCPELIGGYVGAGLRPRSDDIPWRFI